MQEKDDNTLLFSVRLPKTILEKFLECCSKSRQQPENVLSILMTVYSEQAEQNGFNDFSAEYILESGCGTVDGFTREDILDDLDNPDMEQPAF